MITPCFIMIILIDKQTLLSQMTTTKVINKFNKQQPIDRNCSYNLRNRKQSQPLVQTESLSTIYEEMDERKRNELFLCEVFYDYLKDYFVINKKHCYILHEFIIFIIYCFTNIYPILSDI